jgi:hypothetical protein
MLITQAPKGTQDVLPQESGRWQDVEAKMREVCHLAGYREVRTPVFEHTELFLRSVGDTTDVVQKEMYTFLDKGARSITLKPEGTAGVARAFLEAHLETGALPMKMYYISCPVFRYEKPQSGRLREHHQPGIEVFGAKDASCDAEGIRLALDVLAKCGIQGLKVSINSILPRLPGGLSGKAEGISAAQAAQTVRHLPGPVRAQPAANPRLQGTLLPAGADKRAGHAFVAGRGLRGPLRAAEILPYCAGRGIFRRSQDRPRSRLLHAHRV